MLLLLDYERNDKNKPFKYILRNNISAILNHGLSATIKYKDHKIAHFS